MKKFIVIGCLLPALLTATGCSTAGSTSGVQDEYQTMSDLVAGFASAGVQCDPYEKVDSVRLGTKEHGNCTWNGQKLTINLFSGSPDQTKQFVDSVKGMAVGYLLYRGNFTLNVDDEATTKLLASKLGMTLE